MTIKYENDQILQAFYLTNPKMKALHISNLILPVLLICGEIMFLIFCFYHSLVTFSLLF